MSSHTSFLTLTQRLTTKTFLTRCAGFDLKTGEFDACECSLIKRVDLNSLANAEPHQRASLAMPIRPGRQLPLPCFYAASGLCRGRPNYFVRRASLTWECLKGQITVGVGKTKFA